MIPKFLQVQGQTSVARHDMLARVKTAISTSGGYIVDFHRFSNAAICLNIEISFEHIAALYAALQATELRLERASHDLFATSIACAGQLNTEARARELPGSIHITFLHSDPDLRIEAPMVPG